MSRPAAKEGDSIVAVDTHMIQPPGPSSPIPVPHVFNGTLDGELSSDVNIEGMAAATVDSTATNTPSHIPQGGSFVGSPSNKGKIIMGSMSVFINDKAAARLGDTAETCNDPADMPVGTVIGTAQTVLIGG
jgi:uncharacterized Zn-binding protein involved in type VI secretion